MAKCVYCLKKLERNTLTKDHIFPKSWYANSTSSKVQRWTVPACKECNYSLKLSEEEVFLTWAIALDPNEEAASGLKEKMEELVNLDSTKEDFIFRIKSAALYKILSKLTKYDPNRTHKGAGPKNGIRGELAVTTSSKAINDLARKIITGLEYKIRNRYIENSRKIKSYFPMINDPLSDHYLKWEELIKPIKQRVELDPSFSVEYGINPISDEVIYHISIWNHYDIWGWVIN